MFLMFFFFFWSSVPAFRCYPVSVAGVIHVRLVSVCRRRKVHCGCDAHPLRVVAPA
jgi:hypothetical protein